ncbi:MAG: hypothetical protein RLY30_700 [Pseudomonadota bacterium]|jgi:uncharacterized protein YigA (DUF484 family)
MSHEAEQELSPSQVAAYLRAHPRFLEEHPEVLGELALSLGAGGTVSSLLERQVLTLREKLRALDQRQALMLRHAQENEAIQAKLMQLVRALLQAPQTFARAERLADLLQEQFSLTRVELIQAPCEGETEEPLRVLLSASRPSCWSARSDQGQLILSRLAAPTDDLGSLALLPLQPQSADGAGARALVLAASDPSRFEAGQGVVFLERIAEIASAALHVSSA